MSSNVLSSASVEFKTRASPHMCWRRAGKSLIFPPVQTPLNFVFLSSGIFHLQKILHATSQPPPRPRVASDDHTQINTSARLTAGAAPPWDVFSRSQIVPLHFITVWRLLCRRLWRGCNWEQMRRPVRASVVMSARGWGEKLGGAEGGKWSWSDGGRLLEGLWGSAGEQQQQQQRWQKNLHGDFKLS